MKHMKEMREWEGRGNHIFDAFFLLDGSYRHFKGIGDTVDSGEFGTEWQHTGMHGLLWHGVIAGIVLARHNIDGNTGSEACEQRVQRTHCLDTGRLLLAAQVFGA